MMSKLVRGKFLWIVLLGFAFWFVGAYLFHYKLNPALNADRIASFERAVQDKQAQLNTTLHALGRNFPETDTLPNQFNYASKFTEKTGFSFFAYQDGEMSVWTSNQVSLPPLADSLWLGAKVIQFGNGWYLLDTCIVKDRMYVGTYLLKSVFKYQNEDLVNAFNPDLAQSINAEIAEGDGSIAINNIDGKRLFSIIPTQDTAQNDSLEVVIFFAYLVGLIILIQLLINAFQKVILSRPYLLIIFPLGIVFLRYLWLKAEWGGYFSDFQLFNPELFGASEMAPSLGDLTINIAIFYFIVHFLLKRTRNWFASGNQKLKLGLVVIPLFLISFYMAYQINEIIYSLVYNSKISFNLEHLFELNIYSFISLTLIGASFYAYFRLVQYIIIQLKICQFEWNRLAFLWVITSCVYIVVDQFYFDQSILTSLWPIFLSGSLLWFHYKEKDYKFIHVIIMVAFVAFYASYILQGYSSDKEKELRILQAEKIAHDDDVLTELDYQEIEGRMVADRFVVPYYSSDFDQRDFNEHIEEKYYGDLRSKYELHFYLFDADKKLVKDASNFDLKTYDRYEEIITESGKVSSISENLFYIKDYTDNLNYLANLEIEYDDSLYGYLVTEFRSKIFLKTLVCRLYCWKETHKSRVR
jgi:two-component system nitrogen regulation sensor histidine kinase NtrY